MYSLAPALPMKGRGLGQRFPDEGSAYAPYRATSTAPAIGYSPRNLQGGGGRGAPRGWHQVNPSLALSNFSIQPKTR